MRVGREFMTISVEYSRQEDGDLLPQDLLPAHHENDDRPVPDEVWGFPKSTSGSEENRR